MRRVSKFKIPNKKHIFPFFFLKRILHFKRPKWRLVKKKILILKKNRKKLTKYIILKNRIKILKNILFLKKNMKTKFLYSNRFFIFFKKFKLLFKKKKIKFLLQRIKKLNKYLKGPKKGYSKKLLSNNFFFNYTRLKSKIYSWGRLRFNFKENLFMAFSVKRFFSHTFSIKFFKRLIVKTKMRAFNTSTLLIKPEYRLDILLWRLKFCISPFIARTMLRKRSIYAIQDVATALTKSVPHLYFLKAGDIIEIAFSKTFNFKKILHHFVKSIYIPSFVEIDYYTNRIIILKDFHAFTTSDLNSTLKEPLCFYKFKNYLLT